MVVIEFHLSHHSTWNLFQCLITTAGSGEPLPTSLQFHAKSFKQRANPYIACFEHADLFTVVPQASPTNWRRSKRRPPIYPLAKTKKNSVNDKSQGPEQPKSGTTSGSPAMASPEQTDDCASWANYGRFNYNSINIHFQSWNYRGCWHQTFPLIATQGELQSPSISNHQVVPSHHLVQSRYVLSLPPRIEIG